MATRTPMRPSYWVQSRRTACESCGEVHDMLGDVESCIISACRVWCAHILHVHVHCSVKALQYVHVYTQLVSAAGQLWIMTIKLHSCPFPMICTALH